MSRFGRRFIWVLAALCLTFGRAALAEDDIGEHRSCARCGMDRKAFGYSRMLVRYDDGSTVGVCSLHCAVVETEAHPNRKVAALQVADRGTRELVEAEKAVWVMGGNKPGVMTAVPKWAFQSQQAAGSFVSDHGGEIVTWEQALTAAREEARKSAR